MKRIIPLIILTVILVSSCEQDRYYEPYAEFSVDYDLVVPGEVVTFRNHSEDANYFEWDFGDGTRSNDPNPWHHYTYEGIYEVRLAAYHGSEVDYAYYTIEVYETTLELIVKDWDTELVVPRVNLDVYATNYDYLNFQNVIASGVSDYNGVLEIKGLNTHPYYIDAYNEAYNNYTLYSESSDNIRTKTLQYAMHNIYIVWVDYDPSAYKSGVKLKVREIEKSAKSRLVSDKELTKK